MIYILVFLIVTIFPPGILFLYLTLTEYSPEKIEDSIVYRKTRDIDKTNIYSVATYNMGHCVMDHSRLSNSNKIKRSSQISREKTYDNLISITSEIKTFDTDFILLQEVDHNSARSDKTDQIEHIISDITEYNASFAYNFKTKYVPFPLNNPVGGTRSGLMTLSKYAFTSSKRYQLDGQEKYPKSMFYLKRCMLVNEYQLPRNKKLYIINLHFSSYDKDNMFRTEQFEDMLNYINYLYDQGNSYIVVGGDFNYLMDRRLKEYPAWLKPFPDKLYESNFKPVFDSKGFTLKGSDNEKYNIDGFIVSKNVKVIDCKTLDFDFQHSNHNPVKLTFKL